MIKMCSKNILRKKGLRIPKKAYLLMYVLTIILSLILLSSLVKTQPGSYCDSNYICACDPGCQGVWETSPGNITTIEPGFNTIDDCKDGSDKSTWEYVEKMIITSKNNTNFRGGDTVEVYGQFFCYVGNHIAIAYTNKSDHTDTEWRNIYSGTCPVFNFYDFYMDFVLDDNEGDHAFRFIIAYPGEPEMICGETYSSSDTDDIAFFVNQRPDTFAPKVSYIFPGDQQSFEQTHGLEIPILINLTDRSGVDKVIATINAPNDETLTEELIKLTDNSFNKNNQYGFNITNVTMGTYEVSIFYNDTKGNNDTSDLTFFITNDYNINISSPTMMSVYGNNTIWLNFTIQDDTTPFREVYYYLNDPDLNNNVSILDEFFYLGNDKNEGVGFVKNNESNISQSIIVSQNLNVSRIILSLKNMSEGETLLELRTDNLGEPSGEVLANATIQGIMSEEFEWENIYFNQTINLVKDNKYWLVIHKATSDNELTIQTNNDTFSEGELLGFGSENILFKLPDLFKYNALVESYEGINELLVCQKNYESTTICSMVKYKTDTIPPVYSNIIFDNLVELGTTEKFIRITAEDATSSVKNPIIEAEGENHSMSHFSGNTYRHRWTISDLPVGEYFFRIYINDSVDNQNVTSVYSFNISDTTPPVIENINHTPTEKDDLDPDVPINVNASITDESIITKAEIHYKLFGGDVWETVLMNNVSNIYYGSFTPDSEGNWSYRLMAKDEYNNTRLSDIINVSVFYDLTWNIDINEFSDIYAIAGSINTLDNITINNTGDFSLEFSVSKSSGTPTLTFSETSFNITDKETKIVSTNITTPPTRTEPYPYEVKITCITEDCEIPEKTIMGTIAAGEGGPYLALEDLIYFPRVKQGDRRINLNITLKNIGFENASNTTITYELPEGWETNDNLSKNIGEVHIFDPGNESTLASYGVTTEIALDAPIGKHNLTIFVDYTNSTGYSFQRIIIREVEVEKIEVITQPSPPSPPPSAPPPTSGGGPPPSAPPPMIIREDYSLNLSYPKTINAMRGENTTIYMNVTNPYSNALFKDLELEIRGFSRTRVIVEPKIINFLEGKETKTFAITFNIPNYMGHSVNEIFFSIKGSVSGSAFVQQEQATLIVSEVSEEESLMCVAESRIIINNMSSENFSVVQLEKLYEEAQTALRNLDYTRVNELCDEIKNLRDSAYSMKERINTLKEKIVRAERRGYDVDHVISLLELTERAFLSGDFTDSELTLQRTEEAYAFQIQLEESKFINQLKNAVLDYWYVILGTFIFIILSFHIVSVKTEPFRIEKKKKSLTNEEGRVLELIKKTQQDHFVHHKLSKNVYDNRMGVHKKRLADIRENKSKLFDKNRKLFRKTNEYDSLLKQKEALRDEIKNIQRAHFIEKNLDTISYNKTFEEYNKKLSVLNRKIALEEGKKSEKETPNKKTSDKDTTSS